MILTCPSCETQYFADDSTIGDSGRTVKCAACAHNWFVPGKLGTVEDAVIIDGDSAEATAALGAHEAYRKTVREKRQRKSRLAAFTSWAVTGALFFILGAGTVVFRNEIVKVWPQSASAFNFVGLDVNPFGLDFAQTDAQRTFDGTTPILNVTGAVSNVSRSARKTPNVRVGLRDEAGREVAFILTDINPAQIAPGDTGNFTATLPSPPMDAYDLELSFVELGGARSVPETVGRVDAAETPAAPEGATTNP